MERWSSGVMESQPRRMNRRAIWPLAVARRGSSHPHFMHNGPKMEGTIWRELTSRDSVLTEDSASSSGRCHADYGELRSRGRELFVRHSSPFLDELRHDADGDFRNTDRLNVEADWTRDLLQLLGSRQAVFNELLKDQPPFSFAANQTEKDERTTHPFTQHQRVVLMSARDDETERWPLWHRLFQKLFPVIDSKFCSRWKIMRVRQRRAVVEHRDLEIQLQSEWRDGLRDVA